MLFLLFFDDDDNNLLFKHSVTVDEEGLFNESFDNAACLFFNFTSPIGDFSSTVFIDSLLLLLSIFFCFSVAKFCSPFSSIDALFVNFVYKLFCLFNIFIKLFSLFDKIIFLRELFNFVSILLSIISLYLLLLLGLLMKLCNEL